jgi:hypothetical protein
VSYCVGQYLTSAQRMAMKLSSEHTEDHLYKLSRKKSRDQSESDVSALF